MGPKKGGSSSSGDSSDDDNLTTSVTTKATRLKDAKSWPAWRIWFLGQCYTQDLQLHYKKDPATDDAKDAKIYGLIACSVGGQAIEVIESVEEGKGSLAYLALEKQFAKARDLQMIRKFRRALTQKKKPDQSVQKYLIKKRNVFQKIMTAHSGDYEALWKTTMNVALIVNLNDDTLIDHLCMDLGRAAAANSAPKYEELETAIQTYADGNSLRSDEADNKKKDLALAGEEADSKEKGKGQKGKGRSGGTSYNQWSGGFQGYGYNKQGGGGEGYGRFWVEKKKTGTKKKGKGRGNGKGRGRGRGRGGGHQAHGAEEDEDEDWSELR